MTTTDSKHISSHESIFTVELCLQTTSQVTTNSRQLLFTVCKQVSKYWHSFSARVMDGRYTDTGPTELTWSPGIRLHPPRWLYSSLYNLLQTSLSVVHVGLVAMSLHPLHPDPQYPLMISSWTVGIMTSSWRDGTCYSIASYSVPDLTQSLFMTWRNYWIPVCVLVRVGRDWSLKLKEGEFLGMSKS